MVEVRVIECIKSVEDILTKGVIFYEFPNNENVFYPETSSNVSINYTIGLDLNFLFKDKYKFEKYFRELKSLPVSNTPIWESITKEMDGLIEQSSQYREKADILNHLADELDKMIKSMA